MTVVSPALQGRQCCAQGRRPPPQRPVLFSSSSISLAAASPSARPLHRRAL